MKSLDHPDDIHFVKLSIIHATGDLSFNMIPFWKHIKDIAPFELDDEHFMVVVVPVLIAAILEMMVVVFTRRQFHMHGPAETDRGDVNVLCPPSKCAMISLKTVISCIHIRADY